MSLPPPGTPIIIDIGSAYIKVGYAGDPTPRFIFPCIVGTERFKAVMVDVSARSMYVGNDAVKMRGVLKILHPIERGIIQDWDAFYELLNYIFYTLLRIEDLSQYPVVYTESLFVQNDIKEYIARVLFETHRVHSLIFIPTPILSLFSVGLTTGLVIESGDGTTWIVPIINGHIIQEAVQRLNLAGMDVNHNLKSLLMREGINISSSAVDEIIREIKEKNCYFVLDPSKPPKTDDDYIYRLPDGSNLSIPSHIIYEAPEVLFQPNMLGYNIQNLPQASISSIKSVKNEDWNKLISHIVLSGGNVLYSGFEERFRTEFSQLLHQLGSFPAKAPTSNISELTKDLKDEINKLQSVNFIKKKQDNCPHCGALLEITEDLEFCPHCNGRIKLPEINIDLDTKNSEEPEESKEIRCPSCNKEIKDSSSAFCPYCGSMLKSEGQLNSEENIDLNFAGEFNDYQEPSEELIKFFVPDDPQTAIFTGAAILASLPSFQRLFITYQQFLENKNALYIDFSEIF